MSELIAEALTFRYGANVTVTEDWSQTFAPGELVALCGPSGRGKSTILYLLGLMLRPNQGRITIDGRNVSSLGDAQRAQVRANTIGFVFQDAALDGSRTVLDNVLEPTLYARSRTSRTETGRAAELLERFGVSSRASHRPGEISGGQAQRIALCRALISNPGIILADEPTGNLDSVTGTVVLDALREHAESSAAVVIATHDPTVIGACDRRIDL